MIPTFDRLLSLRPLLKAFEGLAIAPESTPIAFGKLQGFLSQGIHQGIAFAL